MSKTMSILLDQKGVAATLERLSGEVRAALPPDAPAAIVGIRSRGEVLAQRMQAALQRRGCKNLAHGSLDITLYRDDLAEIGPAAQVRRTEIEFDVQDCFIVLVDDVLFTGRSARAAIDALVDLGRPRAIRLAVMVDRGGRELPIQADFVGVRTPDPKRHVTVKLVETDGEDCVEVV
ncbi:MAG: bifunctional pyr operon transcriptional regulator/uracil phosphoribosyltransferase PyrR [Phycisphaerae bacterium]|nr:bifunctional pyr operon transcriptional regulator/uracil phosphoribosyltransferase PyrR [Phycisphaerae bacterium]